jgi:hypothetical protein
VEEEGRAAIVSSASLHRARLGALALAGAAAACAGCAGQPADPTFQRHTLMDWIQTADAARLQAGSALRRGAPVLFLDASGNMRGFADPAGSFEYSRALRAVAAMAEELDAAQPLLLRRADTITSSLPPGAASLLTVTRSATFYHGAASDIAATIRSFAAAPRAAAALSRTDAVDILVTDGAQSLPLDAPDPRCAAGADERCVNAAIASLIERGWGAHIFGIRSRFAGPVYSRGRGGGLSGFYRATDPAEPQHFRPFLILVFTERRHDLQPVVDRLRNALEATLDTRLIRELPLTLPMVKSVRPILDTAAYSVRGEVAGTAGPNPFRLATEHGWRLDFNQIPLPPEVQVVHYGWKDLGHLSPGAVHLAAEIELTDAGRAYFGGGARDAERELRFTVHEIARPKTWYGGPRSPAWPPSGYRIKALLFDEAPAERIEDPLRCTPALGGAGGHLILRWAPVGSYLPLVLLRVDSRFDPRKRRVPAWIEAWSTDDDSRPGSASQLLNLRTLASGLLLRTNATAPAIRPWYLVIWPRQA